MASARTSTTHISSGSVAVEVQHFRNDNVSLQTNSITSEERVPVTLSLTLRPRPTVTWDQNVVDNEGLGKKSSKRCCIFHKQREFGESSTDSDAANDSDDSSVNSSKSSSSSSSSSSSGGGFSKGETKFKKSSKSRRQNGSSTSLYPKIAHKKRSNQKKIPDFQRFHA